MIKPLHCELFRCIRKNAKGAIKELIPDLIKIGVDELNLVQVSATGMYTKQLKRSLVRI